MIAVEIAAVLTEIKGIGRGAGRLVPPQTGRCSIWLRPFPCSAVIARAVRLKPGFDLGDERRGNEASVGLRLVVMLDACGVECPFGRGAEVYKILLAEQALADELLH